MGYLRRGQYRLVRCEYNENVYSCLWCHQVIRTSDDGECYYYCPKCGKPWLRRADCRMSGQPRWSYESGIPVPERCPDVKKWQIIGMSLQNAGEVHRTVLGNWPMGVYHRERVVSLMRALKKQHGGEYFKIYAVIK